MRRIGMALIVASGVVLSGCAVMDIDPPDSQTTTSESGDAAIFLEHVRTTWTGTIPGDGVLVEYGELACEQLRAGHPLDSIVVLGSSEPSGADAIANTRSVVDAAALSLCPNASAS